MAVNRTMDGARDASGWRRALYVIIFKTDTSAGRLFDVLLIVSILVSVAVVMLDSVASVRAEHGPLLYGMEWFFTILFTIEYVLRLLCVRRPLRYARSFFGVIDLLAILPSYIDLLVPGGHFLLAIRILRVLRIFRVLKLAHYLSEANYLLDALIASRRKVTVFFGTVLALVVVMGSIMYVVEGEENGFTSIPVSVYWAIVTITTVGYGDISPQTVLGRAIAAVCMIMGYSIIAVPTGIVTVELTQAAARRPVISRTCNACETQGHDGDAVYCKRCGAEL